MSKKSDYRTFYELVTIAITLITITIKFLIEVNKRGLWKECIVSVSLVGGLNYSLYYLGNANILPLSVFGWSCLISFIAFCVYWGGLFNNNPARQFSQSQLKRNSSYWAEQSWWWNLDGWQFEQEVAKIFILNGYKATVTKGSGDGGVDIILEQEGYKAIVQCKHYRNPVPPEPIRALWGCKDDFQANEVILIASSGITQSGADFVSNKPNFKVLNLDDIIRMSTQANNQTQSNYVSNGNYGRRLDV
ncbi:MAG: restriction endonuclease [Candidatus Gastranaerophilales bacterium]|nr:restriction endonuclease [Candidatus Gastranaerophilales bacterium]